MLCRFSANDKPTPVPNARALPEKLPEARETSAPKPSALDVASGRPKEQPPDAQSSVQKAISGVPTKYVQYVLHRHTCTYSYTYAGIAHCICINMHCDYISTVF